MTPDLKAKINNQRRIVSHETVLLNELLAQQQREQDTLGCAVIVTCCNPHIPKHGAMIGLITAGVQGRCPIQAGELEFLQRVVNVADNSTLSWRCFDWWDEQAPHSFPPVLCSLISGACT